MPSSARKNTPAEGGPISNTVTVSSATNDAHTGNNSATEQTTVTVSADLEISKSDSPDPFVVYGSGTHTVLHSFPTRRSSDLPITVSDTLPAGVIFQSASGTDWSCSGTNTRVSCTRAMNLAVGAAPPITIIITAPAEGGPISNTVTVSSATNDAHTGNNSATEQTTVTASADLAIRKSDSPDPVVAAWTLTYTVAVSNGAPSPAAAPTTLSDTLPAGVI